MSKTEDHTPTEAAVDRAISAFEAGEPVMIHDDADREGETDLIYPAEAVTPAALARLRNDAGGLVCVALPFDVAEAFGLPFMQDLIDHPIAAKQHLGYDERSSFSLTVNHRETYTGITDEDRALTITKLAEAAADPTGFAFSREFRSPGHVHVLKAAPGLVADRQGHTELGLVLAHAAGVTPAVVVCEMLDDATGRALSPAAARAYAADEGIPMLEGVTVIDHLDDGPIETPEAFEVEDRRESPRRPIPTWI